MIRSLDQKWLLEVVWSQHLPKTKVKVTFMADTMSHCLARILINTDLSHQMPSTALDFC